MERIIHEIVRFLSSFSPESAVFIIAALPIAELRFSIPIGIYFFGKSAIVKIFIISILGNMLPVIPALFLLNPVSERLRHFRLWRKFFDWLMERTKKNADLIQKYEALGLALFVGVPLPGTGAWSGCIAASLFKIKFRYAFLAIFLGVLIAGLIVTALSLGGLFVWENMR